MKCHHCFHTHRLFPPWHGFQKPALLPAPSEPTGENERNEGWMKICGANKHDGCQRWLTHRCRQVGHSFDVQKFFINNFQVLWSSLAWAKTWTLIITHRNLMLFIKEIKSEECDFFMLKFCPSLLSSDNYNRHKYLLGLIWYWFEKSLTLACS